MCSPLPQPVLRARLCGARSILVLTDDALARACGVRIAFSGRAGGLSAGRFATLNLGDHVDDKLSLVQANRRALLDALGAPVSLRLVVPCQVHGKRVLVLDGSSQEAFERSCEQAREGVDALVVQEPQLAALLCFADCVPLIVVSPTGRFAVVHAGWRGVDNGIAALAVTELERLDAGVASACDYNVYMGPHIGAECFEVGASVYERFEQRYGSVCLPDSTHVDLGVALRVCLTRAGVSPQRIADAGICTVCHHDEFFSYRASGGACGRHGAVAFYEEGKHEFC